MANILTYYLLHDREDQAEEECQGKHVHLVLLLHLHAANVSLRLIHAEMISYTDRLKVKRQILSVPKMTNNKNSFHPIYVQNNFPGLNIHFSCNLQRERNKICELVSLIQQIMQ